MIGIHTDSRINSYVPNAMFTFDVFVFCLPGWAMRSKLAVVHGFYQWIALWVHYYCVEKQDVAYIYGIKPRLE